MELFETGFTGITVFILASNETEALSETVKKVFEYCPEELLSSITILPINESCPGAEQARKIAETDRTGKVNIYYQKNPGVDNCIAETIQMVESSHFIYIAADLEMDPSNIRTFAERVKDCPGKIVCASKWIKGSEITGYNKMKEATDRLMNFLVSVLYLRKVTDVITIYQVYPSELAKRINVVENDEVGYLFTLVLLRLGIAYEEIPTVYIHRREGKPSVSFRELMRVGLRFTALTLRTRFTPKRKILKQD